MEPKIIETKTEDKLGKYIWKNEWNEEEIKEIEKNEFEAWLLISFSFKSTVSTKKKYLLCSPTERKSGRLEAVIFLLLCSDWRYLGTLYYAWFWI